MSVTYSVASILSETLVVCNKLLLRILVFRRDFLFSGLSDVSSWARSHSAMQSAIMFFCDVVMSWTESLFEFWAVSLRHIADLL